MNSNKVLHCGHINLQFDAHEPNDELKNAIENRQTSRKKYTASLLESEKEKLVRMCNDEYGFSLKFLSKKLSHKVIWLNQRAVFDDMFNEPVRKELDHWLRYNSEEKSKTQDGLAYDCMELSGGLLHFFVKHYRLLHWPLIKQILKQYYLRTMKDSSSVGYIMAPFKTEKQSYEIGRCIIDVWLDITKEGKYLHPFGTIVANEEAHSDFVNMTGNQSTESRNDNFVVFIFRAGQSPKPVESLRIPYKEHLYVDGGVA
jgi:hypothetical protein